MDIKYLICKNFKAIDACTGVASIKKDLLIESFMVIKRKGRFVGVLCPSDLVQRPHNLAVDCLVAKPVVNAGQSIEHTLEIMNQSGFDVLPVMENDVFAGVIRRRDIFSYLNEYKNELEQAVEKRTRELRLSHEKLASEMEGRIKVEKALMEAEKRLLVAQKMEAIGVFAGGIAHDFNNILQPLIGYSELVLEDLPSSSPIKESVGEILKSALRATDLVRRILNYSRQSSKGGGPVFIQTVLADVLKLIRPMLPSTIEIREQIRKDCTMVAADPAQLHQIAMNLVTNAYHAMMKTGGILTVGLEDSYGSSQGQIASKTIPPPFVILSVADTGVGMSAEIVEKIFDPFFTTKEEGTGTGLGLSVVYSIVKGMNGDVTVRSKPGTGTIFSVFLPAHSGEHLLPEISFHEPIIGGTETILVVDDEEEIVKLEKKMLERIGYCVETCTDCVKALERFRSNPYGFDIIITDMTMPLMTGEAFAEKIGQIRNNIPVIICTGYSEKLSQGKAFQPNVKGVLIKPLSARQLAGEIRKLLDTVDTSHRNNTYPLCPIQ